jgi:hypothetical protein
MDIQTIGNLINMGTAYPFTAAPCGHWMNVWGWIILI